MATTKDAAAERRAIDEVVKGQTVCTMFQETVRQHPEIEALKWKEGEEWRSLTWAEYGERVRELANGFLSLGLRPGQAVTIIGRNLPEYVICDLAILHAGGVPVSLYNTLAPEQTSYIVNHCEARFAVVEDRDFYERFLKIRGEIPNVEKAVMWHGADELSGDDWAVGYGELFEAGRRYAAESPDELERRWKAVGPDDLATLIYTSGTTGPPKGVMITHYNVCWTAESLSRLADLQPGTRQISYLPMAHIAERMTGHYLAIKYGSTVAYCPDVNAVAGYLGEVRPQFFFAVPRVWEKVYDRLRSALENNPDPEQKRQADEAIEASLEKVRLEQAGKPIPAELSEQLEVAEVVTSLIRSLVGMDDVKVVSSGAAPIARDILEFFHAVGIPIAEVYGQSEDTGPTSFNPPDAVKIGTVGPAIPGVEVKLADDGEVLVRGGNVMPGYYKEPELTAETIDSEGWLHSGDIGELDEDGYLRIVDRKKEILITAGGKNVAPSNIENLVKGHPIIGQVAVIGDNRPYLVALIVLDAEGAAEWAQKREKPTDLAQLAEDPEVIEEIQRHIDEVNTHLHNQEQVKRFSVLPVEWTPESEELTPTLKLKRRVIEQKYADRIESLYAR